MMLRMSETSLCDNSTKMFFKFEIKLLIKVATICEDRRHRE